MWRANFTESNSYGFVAHELYWDSVSNLTRWDQTGNLDASGPSVLSLINNYTVPVEWVNFVSQGSCQTYGNDAYYPFAFGAAMSMAYGGRTDAGIDLWRIPGSQQASWMTQDLGDGLCQLVAWTRGSSSAVSTGFVAGPIDPSVFAPAASCLQSPVFAGCRADAVRHALMAKP